jgi:hypothetical protein
VGRDGSFWSGNAVLLGLNGFEFGCYWFLVICYWCCAGGAFAGFLGEMAVTVERGAVADAGDAGLFGGSESVVVMGQRARRGITGPLKRSLQLIGFSLVDFALEDEGWFEEEEEAALIVGELGIVRRTGGRGCMLGVGGELLKIGGACGYDGDLAVGHAEGCRGFADGHEGLLHGKIFHTGRPLPFFGLQLHQIAEFGAY